MTDEHDPEISARYRRTRFEQPSPETDAAIRKLAHQAVAGRKRSRFSVLRLAVAASLLLGVGLTLRVFELAPPEAQREPAHQELAPAQSLSIAPALGKKPEVDRRRAVPPVPASPAERQGLSGGAADSVASEKRKYKAADRAGRPTGQVEVLGARRVPQSAVECDDLLPDDPEDPQQWRERIDSLKQAAQHARALCLQRMFEERFREPESTQTR
jgi:hypothetical protein